jgi:hypothetical protein
MIIAAIRRQSSRRSADNHHGDPPTIIMAIRGARSCARRGERLTHPSVARCVNDGNADERWRLRTHGVDARPRLAGDEPTEDAVGERLSPPKNAPAMRLAARHFRSLSRAAHHDGCRQDTAGGDPRKPADGPHAGGATLALAAEDGGQPSLAERRVATDAYAQTRPACR